MKIQNQKAYDELVKSRIQLLIHYPFYGTLALSLKLVEECSIETAAVDGENFYYNPKFIESLKPEEVNWIVAHEVMHCALGHIWRRGSRIHQKFNVACDYAIHSILKEDESKDMMMPKGCLYDPKFNNKSAEEIYDMLPESPNKDGNDQSGSGSGNSNGNSNGNGSGNGEQNPYGKTLDDHSKWNNSSTQNKAEEKKQEWLEKMVNSADAAEMKRPGSVPGGITRIVKSIKKPQKNWKELLAEFIQFEIHDYGFLPPDKRFYGFSDVLMPDFNEQTEKIQDIVLAVDTSGSIGDKELTVIYSEMVGMMQQFNSSVRGHIIFADYDVAAVYDFDSVDDILKSKPKGGGGTSFIPAIKYAMDKKEKDEWDVCGLVYLTDLYGDSSNEEVNKDTVPFNVLWVSTTKSAMDENSSLRPEYGTVTYLKV